MSNNYVCEKVGSFRLSGKTGSDINITLEKHEFTAGSYSDIDYSVPKLFDEFILSQYQETGKTVNVKALVNGVFERRKTGITKKLVKSVGKDNIEMISYFCVENADISSSEYCRLDDSWSIFLDCLWHDHWFKISDCAEFIKIYNQKQRYNFITFDVENDEKVGLTRFGCGYRENANYLFEELKRNFVNGNIGIAEGVSDEKKEKKIIKISNKYLLNISFYCNLPDEIISSIKCGDIKVLYYAKDTGICDQIVWYTGELKEENIRIHLFSEGEKVISIDDNTEFVNSMIVDALNGVNDTVPPKDKEETVSNLLA